MSTHRFNGMTRIAQSTASGDPRLYPATARQSAIAPAPIIVLACILCEPTRALDIRSRFTDRKCKETARERALTRTKQMSGRSQNKTASRWRGWPSLLCKRRRSHRSGWLARRTSRFRLEPHPNTSSGQGGAGAGCGHHVDDYGTPYGTQRDALRRHQFPIFWRYLLW